MTASARASFWPDLDQRDVVLEVDGDDRVAAGDQVDAVTELLRLAQVAGAARRRGRRAASPLRRL